MGLQRIQDELVRQMKDKRLRFNIESDGELREVIEESSEYIEENYPGNDMQKVTAYLNETMENYPEHIEPIREYIERIAA